MSEPLWSDLKIDERAVKELNDYGTMTLFTAKRLFHQMRDEYEAERAAMQEQLIDRDKRVAELERAYKRIVELNERNVNDAVRIHSTNDAVFSLAHESIKLMDAMKKKVDALQAEVDKYKHGIPFEGERPTE